MKFTRRDFLTASAVAIGSAPSLPGIDRVFARQGSEAVFRHGVASGDPLRDRVVLWTRVTPGTPGEVVDVGWMIARDARMSRVVASGSVRTSAERDYTVKLDAVDARARHHLLLPLLGARRAVAGRAHAHAAGASDAPRPAGDRVVLQLSRSASSTSTAAIAARADLDAVLHLGDYIYEYANGRYGDRAEGDGRAARTRVVSRSRDRDARRLPRALRRSIARIPICRRRTASIRSSSIWDDHEFANNAWRDGAENHNAAAKARGRTEKRRRIRAWREWMPVREVPRARTTASTGSSRLAISPT